MQIASTDFQDNEPIPPKYSAFVDNINPALTISEVPDNTESLALILEDQDAPGGTFTHWIIYNMSPVTLQITPGELPLSGIEGTNDNGDKSYFGPKPPSGVHHYNFRLFALRSVINFVPDSEMNRATFLEAIDGKIIEEANLVGTFEAPTST